MTRMDGKEDVLIVQTYLVDSEVPFLCGKQTLETWNFKIDGQEKILEIQMKLGQDNDKKCKNWKRLQQFIMGLFLKPEKRRTQICSW